MSHKIFEEAGFMILALISTVFVSSILLQMIVATITLMTAKIIDHYLRRHVIGIIDKVVLIFKKKTKDEKIDKLD